MLQYAQMIIDEFCEREQSWRDDGGKFIVPMPDFRII